MTSKTTGSGADEGESTCDGEVFFPLPWVTLIVSVWLQIEQCTLVQGWWVWTETTNKLEQLLSSTYFLAYCHGGWFRAVGPSWHLEAQALYIQARTESKGSRPPFPVMCSSFFLRCQAFLLTLVTHGVADLLGSKMDNELCHEIHWGWLWLSLDLSPCLGGEWVFGCSVKAGSMSILLRIAQAAIPALWSQAAYHRVNIYPLSQGGSPSLLQQPGNGGDGEGWELYIVSFFGNYKA